MPNIDKCTEKLIKEKATALFFVLGHINASSQEIADYAGVKRTLVNYYFRSKNNLFKITYDELITNLKSSLKKIYISKQPFSNKVEELIDFLIFFRESYPYLEIFNIQEINNINWSADSILQPQGSAELNYFIKEVEQEMENGLIKKYHPINFILNIFSLVSFPIVMKPLFIEIFDIDKSEFIALLKARKQVIKTILFN
jgi:AcrR family transcriptional regulator